MKNVEKLTEFVGKEHRPFIVYDVETTGVMNGNNNRITEIALSSYRYNTENKQYELQDKIFMLARADKECVDNILQREQPTEENIRQLLKEEYSYEKFLKPLKDSIRNCQNRQKTCERKISDYAREKKDTLLEKQTEKLKQEQELETDLKKQLELVKDSDTNGTLFLTEEFQTFCGERTEKKMEDLRTSVKLEKVLATQGIAMEEWEKGTSGLTVDELQIGMDEFFKTYDTKDTVLISNGVYYASHYLEKEGLRIPEKQSDCVIDMQQVSRSQLALSDDSKWVNSVSDFAKNYEQTTGKKIQIFDALTKALCLGEMAAQANGLVLSNRSAEYLANAVKESAFTNDNRYVMSLTSRAMHDWHIADEQDYDFADYHFNSLSFVDFGNDRRYIDIDKMFEMNDNFEITLEGEKEPIKSWEELEAKIKALNSDISEELLNKIKDKYEEMKDIAFDKEEAFIQQKLQENMDDFHPVLEAQRSKGKEPKEDVEDSTSKIGKEDSGKAPRETALVSWRMEETLRKFNEQMIAIAEEKKKLETELQDKQQAYFEKQTRKVENDLRSIFPYAKLLNPSDRIEFHVDQKDWYSIRIEAEKNDIIILKEAEKNDIIILKNDSHGIYQSEANRKWTSDSQVLTEFLQSWETTFTDILNQCEERLQNKLKEETKYLQSLRDDIQFYDELNHDDYDREER